MYYQKENSWESLKYYDLYTKHNPIINHQFDQNLEEIQQLTRYSKQEKFYSQFQLKIFRELEQEYNPKDSARIHPSQTEIVSIRFQEQ